MERVARKRPLGAEGIPPRIEDKAEAMVIFAEFLDRGRAFYPNADEAAPRRSRVCRIVPLAEG